MRELAEFEGYLDRFVVDEAELRRRGFPLGEAPQFSALIAEHETGVRVGYAVSYLIPFTYDLRPTLVLKELFVRSEYRAQGVGKLLLQRLHEEAVRLDCGQIKWVVLPCNERAKAFYRRWNGRPDGEWEDWCRPMAR